MWVMPRPATAQTCTCVLPSGAADIDTGPCSMLPKSAGCVHLDVGYSIAVRALCVDVAPVGQPLVSHLATHHKHTRPLSLSLSLARVLQFLADAELDERRSGGDEVRVATSSCRSRMGLQAPAPFVCTLLRLQSAWYCMLRALSKPARQARLHLIGTILRIMLVSMCQACAKHVPSSRHLAPHAPPPPPPGVSRGDGGPALDSPPAARAVVLYRRPRALLHQPDQLPAADGAGKGRHLRPCARQEVRHSFWRKGQDGSCCCNGDMGVGWGHWATTTSTLHRPCCRLLPLIAARPAPSCLDCDCEPPCCCAPGAGAQSRFRPSRGAPPTSPSTAPPSRTS